MAERVWDGAARGASERVAPVDLAVVVGSFVGLLAERSIAAGFGSAFASGADSGATGAASTGFSAAVAEAAGGAESSFGRLGGTGVRRGGTGGGEARGTLGTGALATLGGGRDAAGLDGRDSGSGARADCAARAARTDNGVTDAPGIGVRLARPLDGARSELGARESRGDDADGGSEGRALAGREGVASGLVGATLDLGCCVAESSVGRASVLGLASAAGETLNGAGFELAAPSRRDSAGCISDGSAGPLGITGETSGLESSLSASPAHSESISSVSGAIDDVRDVRATASDNSDGRDRTGPSEAGWLAGFGDDAGCDVPDALDARSGALGVDVVVSDFGASLLAPPFFRPRSWRLMLSRNHMARFPRKCESAERPFRSGAGSFGARHARPLA